jgi:hypothetical protein
MLSKKDTKTWFLVLVVLLSSSLGVSLYLMYANTSSIRKDGWFAPILASLIWMSVVYLNESQTGTLSYHPYR